MMKKGIVWGTVLFIGLFMVNSLLYAENTSTTVVKSNSKTALLRPAIQLDSLVPIKKTEKDKDEIYVSVSEFNSNGKNRYYTIPQSPVYWPDKSVNQISNFQLWQGKLPAKGATEVIISLIEQDTPPWNLDDLIGVIKIKMMNDAGQLRYEWYQDGKLIGRQKDKISIHVMGHEGIYKANLSLIMRNSTKAEVNRNAVMDQK